MIVLAAVSALYYRTSTPVGMKPHSMAGTASSRTDLTGFPQNGHVDWFIGMGRNQSLGSITYRDGSGDGTMKSIRIRTPEGDPVAQMTIHPDSDATISLPLGSYRWTVGHGTRWIDKDEQFGRSGAYFDMGSISIAVPYQYGTQTMTIQRPKLVPAGIPTNHIRASEF